MAAQNMEHELKNIIFYDVPIAVYTVNYITWLPDLDKLAYIQVRLYNTFYGVAICGYIVSVTTLMRGQLAYYDNYSNDAVENILELDITIAQMWLAS